MYQQKPNEYYPTAPPPPPVGVPTGYYQGQPQRPTRWSTGLCGCTEDCGNCCMTCFCPCVTFGRIAEIVDKGSTSCGTSGTLYTLLMCFTGCQWLYSCSYRSKLRGQYNLQATPCNDCLLHCCCGPFALCQEYRELKNQGFNMKIGWYGNVERQARGMNVPPVVQGTMMR